MSMSWAVEADARFTADALTKAAHSIGAVVEVEADGDIAVTFPGSGLSLYGTLKVDEYCIHAENPMGARFKVKYRCFAAPNHSNYDDCMRDFEALLRAVYSLTAAQFIASFQHETTLFYNVGQGVIAVR